MAPQTRTGKNQADNSHTGKSLRSEAPITVVEEYDGVPHELAVALHEVITRAYEPFKHLTVFQHTYPLDEWLDLITDPAYHGIVAWVDGELAAFTGVNTDLAKARLLHPEFVAARFPGERVFYNTDLVVRPDLQQTGVLWPLFETCIDYGRRMSARIIFYCCEVNRDAGFPDLVAAVIADQIDGSVEPLDSISFYSFRVRNR